MKVGALGLAICVGLLTGCGPGIQGKEDPNLPDDPGYTGKSLWPLTAGSVWTYRITDPIRGVFTKRVEVLGPKTVTIAGGPEQNAVAVKSTQPHLEELSWQLDVQGTVLRLKEDDFKAGVLQRSTYWTPSALKAISAPRESGWSFRLEVEETIQRADGTGETDQEVYTWTVLAAEEEVVVPAGTFRALKVQRERIYTDREAKVRTYWLVPGIGKVREEGERLEELTGATIQE